MHGGSKEPLTCVSSFLSTGPHQSYQAAPDRTRKMRQNVAREISMKKILITGITGQQGGSVARALSGKGLRLCGMTRKPRGDAARAAESRGIEIVEGDLNDADSLRRALEGVASVFAVQNTWEAGVDVEEEQGTRLASLAKEEGVEQFVYGSVGSADRETGISHFDVKARIEQAVRDLGFKYSGIVRPVYFMENLISRGSLDGNQLTTALPPTAVVQMIAVDDIGKYVAPFFLEPERFNGREVDIAGDQVTMPQAAATMATAFSRPIELVQISLDEVRAVSDDIAIMTEWLGRVGYDADIEATAKEFGVTPTSLETWARTRV
jgi:uncharacterized protein YbjT (DUF2867 family)